VNASASMPWTPLNQHSSATAGAKTTGAALWQARALAEFLEASSPTHCQFVTRDRYGRFVGNCFRSDDKSIAAYLVRSGMAMDWPQYSKGQYAQEQAGAKSEKRGLWGVSSHPHGSGGQNSAERSRSPTHCLPVRARSKATSRERVLASIICLDRRTTRKPALMSARVSAGSVLR
jgi:hypothetical protein